jgi:hypothetical protein
MYELIPVGDKVYMFYDENHWTYIVREEFANWQYPLIGWMQRYITMEEMRGIVYEYPERFQLDVWADDQYDSIHCFTDQENRVHRIHVRGAQYMSVVFQSTRELMLGAPEALLKRRNESLAFDRVAVNIENYIANTAISEYANHQAASYRNLEKFRDTDFR